MKKLRIVLLLFFVVTAGIYAAYIVRDRMTSDYVAPVIHAEEDSLRISVQATDADLMAGMTAEDNLDGDVTDTLVIESKGKFISRGTRQVNYAAFDNNKNVGTYTREVTYTDYVSPHFRLTEPLRFLDNNKSLDYLRALTAEDCLDGDITRQIKMNYGELIDVSETLDEREVSFQVSNSAGDTSTLDLIARIEDRTSYYQPAPALRDYVVYTPKRSVPELTDYLIGIWTAGETKPFAETEFTPENVVIVKSNLNVNLPGTYTVTFQLVEDEVPLGSTTMYVIVEE